MKLKNQLLAWVATIALLVGILPVAAGFAAEPTANVTFNGAVATVSGVSVAPRLGTATTAVKAGETGWVLERLCKTGSPNHWLRLDVNDGSALANLDGSSYPVITIQYYDGDIVPESVSPNYQDANYDENYASRRYGGFCLYYDALDETTKNVPVLMGNTGAWVTKRIPLYDAKFSNQVAWGDAENEGDTVTAQNHASADMVLSTQFPDRYCASKEDVVIGSVTIEDSGKAAPFVISATSEKPGNIFREGEKISLTMNYQAREFFQGAKINVTYTVKDYKENPIIEKAASFTGISAKDTLTIEKLPYGVYELYVTLTGEGIEQTYVTDFSYAKKAENLNPKMGINAHFDDKLYTNTDQIKTVVDLAKDAGFSMVRSSIRWWLVEETKGVYEIPENVAYGEQYLEDNGMEMLGILYTELASNNNHYNVPGYPNALTESGQLEAFQSYCEAVAKKLKRDENDVDYFCMLNEYNTGWSENSDKTNSPQAYTEIAKYGYNGLRAGNSKAFVNAGALAGISLEYINGSVSDRVLDYSDSYSVHLYDRYRGPEADRHLNHGKILYRLITEAYPEKKTWVTETGWATAPKTLRANGAFDEEYNDTLGLWLQDGACSELEQARWYARSMAINRDGDKRPAMLIYYALQDDRENYFDIRGNFGLVHALAYRTPFAAKPAYLTVAASNDILGGATFVSYVLGSADVSNAEAESFAAKFTKDGNDIVCIWSGEEDTSPDSYTFTTDKQYILSYDMYGNVTGCYNGTSKEFTSNVEPIYLMGADTAVAVASVENTTLAVNSAVTEPTPTPVKDMVFKQEEQEIVSGWFIQPEKNLMIQFPTVGEVGKQIAAICAMYHNDALISADINEITVTNEDTTQVEFFITQPEKADRIRFLIWDGVDTMVPLRDAKEMTYIDRDASLNATLKNGVCEISGTEKFRSASTPMQVTVFQKDTKHIGREGKILYMNQIQTGENGDYSFRFPVANQGESIILMLSTKNGTVQCMIPVTE